MYKLSETFVKILFKFAYDIGFNNGSSGQVYNPDQIDQLSDQWIKKNLKRGS